MPVPSGLAFRPCAETYFGTVDEWLTPERAALTRPRCAEQWGRMCYDTVKRWLIFAMTAVTHWNRVRVWGRFRANGSPLLVLHDTTEFSFQGEKPHAIGSACRSDSGRDKAARLRSHTVCGILMHSGLAVQCLPDFMTY
jgi:hypothetical protein